MIDKKKEKLRNLRKYKKKREQNSTNGCKETIGTLDARKLRSQGNKYCPKCKQIKSLDEFNKSKNSNFGYSSHCTLCSRELSKQYYNPKNNSKKYNDNKKAVRNYRLKRKFGITLDEYNKKLLEQNERCAICWKTIKENGKSLAVDHNHETGEVRDLLCANCNAAIGFAQENIDIIKSMVKYIERWSK